MVRVGIVLALLAAGTALASPAGARAQRGRPNPEAAQAIEQLGATGTDEVRGAIETLGLLGDPSAVAPLSARIRRGLPPELLDAAIDALMVLGRPEAGPVLFELTSHRRPEVRARAILAIGATRPRGADRVLSAALADGDPTVRAAAATVLGELGATSAIDVLFQALDRGLPEAAVAIGRVARPADVTRFLGYLGRLPFEAVTSALREMLPRTDLAERSRLEVVHRVAELATPEVAVVLVRVASGLPDSPVRRAAVEAAGRIGR